MVFWCLQVLPNNKRTWGIIVVKSTSFIFFGKHRLLEKIITTLSDLQLMKFGKSIKSSFLVYPTCLLNFTKSSHSTCLFGPLCLRKFHKISTLLVFWTQRVKLQKFSGIEIEIFLQKWFQPNVCIKALLMQAMFIFDPFFQTTNKILDCCFVNKYRLSQKNCRKIRSELFEPYLHSNKINFLYSCRVHKRCSLNYGGNVWLL